MKLFIVTCLKDNIGDVQHLFKEARIHVFSMTDVTGFKQTESGNILEDWFASGEQRFDSAFVFSFASAENIDQCMLLIQAFNQGTATAFPIRAFVLPVEKAI